MKKSLLLSILLLCLVAIQGKSQNSLKVSPVQTSWSTYPATITEAEVFIKPQGTYIQYDIYMKYTAKSYYQNYTKDTFEVQHFFNLPANALVIDSWLWVNNTIMKAKLMDRWSALNIYEGIVKRRQDPSILFKNSATQYEYRIFPLAGGANFRKVKLSFLLPANWRNGELAIDLPIAMLKTSYNPINITINTFETNEWKKPKFTTPNITFTEKVDTINGKYWTTNFQSTQLSSMSALTLNYSGNINDVYFAHYPDPKGGADEGYYKLAFQPKKLLSNTLKPSRKTLFFVDYDEGSTFVSKTELLAELQKKMLDNLTVGDSFNIAYTNLFTKLYANKFIEATPAAIEKAIMEIKLNNFANIKGGLPICYDFMREHKGTQLVIASSSTEFTNITGSQAFKDALVKEFGKLPPTFILDLKKAYTGSYIYYNNRQYYGNELFYTILTSNSFGSLTELMDFGNSTDLSFANLFNDISIVEIGDVNIDIFLKPENGLCFEPYRLNPSSSSSLDNIVQVGRYKGKLPFNLEVVILNKGNVSTKTYSLNPSNESTEVIKQIHQGLKLNQLENRINMTNLQISAVIELSKNVNILSRYTAFLALEPGLQDTCNTCVNQSSSGGGTASTTNANNKKAFDIKASPNPFNDEVTIQIEDIENEEDIVSMEIYNMQGTLVKKFDAASVTDKKLILTWNAENEASGMYIFRLKTKKKVHSIKLIKL